MYKTLAETNNLAKRIEELTIRLTNVISVTETAGEIAVSQEVFNIFMEMDYYKEHPEDVYIQDIPTDRLGRKNVIAILRGQKNNSKKAISLLGHTDTVGISDYGTLVDFCNKPYELTEKMSEIIHTLPTHVQEDMNSEKEDFLFGRGIFDMKSGDAIIIALMEAISKDLENFEGNIIYTAVCDEESNSAGMFAAVPELNRIRNDNDWDILGMIDTDYMTNEYHGDEDKYVYVGAVGKLMPSFFVVGQETHVGESFNGFDPNQMVAELTKKINMNTEYCDIAEGQVTLPPLTLKQRDLKPEYSVQSAKTSTLFFNYATHKSTPDEVLEKMVVAAKECMQTTIDDLNKQYKKFCEMSKIEHKVLPWKEHVITYDELYAKVKEEMGIKLDVIISEFEEEKLKDEKMDERDYALALVEKVHNLWSDRDPVIVVYFTPPYYPHILVDGETEKEQKVLKAVKDAVSETKSDYKLVYKNFFPYIADISFAAAPQGEDTINALKHNMPGFGTKYIMPLDDMAELNLPVLDIGPFGKDAHKYTERLETNYSFNITPELVYRTMVNLLTAE
ncbi:MAG: M20/M25/M40 family metallo-hydrolase [Vagococcus sp.]|uniref:M20/M25/M40 family metallo-hydrolase n=1 Tax=Vagococcus sp. TaxID=1933889 RepID=UPI002FCAE738